MHTKTMTKHYHIMCMCMCNGKARLLHVEAENSKQAMFLASLQGTKLVSLFITRSGL